MSARSSQVELSGKALLKVTISTLLLALTALLLFVLPAEFDRDPTGIGGW